MPFYTYKCNECGVYDEWKSSSAQFNEVSYCPLCRSVGKRVFQPPNILRTSHALRKRVENGAEPKLVKREELKGTPRHHHHHSHQQVARPWQVGH